jgi:hypothetical protein
MIHTILWNVSTESREAEPWIYGIYGDLRETLLQFTDKEDVQHWIVGRSVTVVVHGRKGLAFRKVVSLGHNAVNL